VVGAFAEARDDAKADRVPVELDPGDDGEMLVALLEDVVYAVDALDAVPLAATLHERADGGVSGWLETVPATSVIEVGATPKGVSRSDLWFAEEEKGRWRCRIEIDV
jgi:SHS2 domain-containing protein